jgi:hypothetical protein
MAERYDISPSGVFVGKELSHTETTRLFLLPERLESNFRITLVHQRKSPSGSWKNEPSPSLSTLKAGEAKKFILDYKQTANLIRELENLTAIVEQTGQTSAAAHLVVAPENEVVVADHDRANAIKAILEKGYSDEIWTALVQTDPDLATRLSYARVHTERANALREFENNLDLDAPESWWEDFFERNTWIFGYGLNYKFLRTLQRQPRYGGISLSGKGLQKGDFLKVTEAELKFTVLVEIKKPSTQLLRSTQYRNGAWTLDPDLTGGVSQLQSNCNKWEKEGAQSEENREALLKEKIFTVQPKGILIIGRLSQLTDLSKRNSFELFRRNLVNPEILTFDELFQRAAFIVKSTKDEPPTT